MFKRNIWYSCVPSVIWFFIIIIGSLLPSSEVRSIDVSDKWIHFVFYAIFSFLLFLSTHTNTKSLNSCVKRWSLVLIIGTVVGLSIELIQRSLISGRHGEWMDVLVNTIGLLGGVFVAELLKSKGVL